MVNFKEVKDMTFDEVIERLRAEHNRLELGLPSFFPSALTSQGVTFDDGVQVKITVGRDILGDD